METKVKSNPVVAIAGVTGAVGAEYIATMDKRAFRVGKLKALASARSATPERRGAERNSDRGIAELTLQAWARTDRRVGKANGSRECAPDDKLSVPTINIAIWKMVGTLRFAHPHMRAFESSIPTGGWVCFFAFGVEAARGAMRSAARRPGPG